MRIIHRTQSVLIVVGLILLAMPAHSQGMSRGGKGSKRQDQQQTAQKKKDAQALDKAYQAGLDRIPDASKKQDPWQNIRNSSGRSRNSSASGDQQKCFAA
jgi:hypothetical protein